METIKILYIDDKIDVLLEKYLDKQYINDKYKIEYDEFTFDPSSGYESLIRSQLIRSANIIFIDSMLFENRTATDKFSGEEFKIILKKYFPFIEVIVITQNDINTDIGMVSKYDHRHADGKDAEEYYSEKLKPCINNAIYNIMCYRKLAQIMEENEGWEPVLKEKIINSLEGMEAYDELTKDDIDQMIEAFKEIQEKLDD